ncbi:MAG: diguanylate cyclase [Deltaproteobacteria bacterium]|nr:diguanylate cyclase [Deltaproteobacteria bacterium]
MPFGFYKIGRIANGQTSKFLTNDVVNDPQIMDHEWARGLGLVAFAGYKLQDTNGEPIGVLALFSKQYITPEEDAMLEGLAGMAAHVIQTMKAKGALKMERDKLMNILESMKDGVYIVNQSYDIEYVNPVIEKEFGSVNGRKCYKYFHDRDEVCPWCKNPEVFAGKTVQWEWHSEKNNKTYDLLDTPLRNPDGTISKLEIFRDITERKYAEYNLAIQYSVVRVLAESATLKEATPKIIEVICESAGWDTGVIWVVDHQAEVLRCIEYWHRPSVDFSEFEAITRQFTFQKGVGMPGSVWGTGKPVWITEIAEDINFPRASYAVRAGLHSAFGFPIKIGDEVLGVIEFFSREIHRPYKGMLQMFNAIGSQLGQFMVRKRTEDALLVSEEKFRGLAEQSIVGTCLIQDGKFVYVNQHLAETLNFRQEEMLGLTVLNLVAERDRDTVKENMRKRISGEVSYLRYTFNALKKGGLEVPMEVHGSAMEYLGRPAIMATLLDITERKLADEKIKHMAYHDPLTDLPNRTLFYDRLHQAILSGHRENEPVALMFLDLDSFKDINDTHGHHYGDFLLKQVGSRIREILRESDTVARIGGDEFAIVLPRPEKIEGAVRTAEKIIEAIRTPFSLEKMTLSITASIGIAIFPDHGKDINLLLKKADEAMYAAKESGRGFAVYGK